MAAVAAPKTEKEAMLAIKRLVQRIRLATPENIDELEAELLKNLEEQVEVLGAQHAKLKEESDKAIAVGKKRATQITEKRAKEEEQNKEQRATVKEFTDLLDVLEASVRQLRETASLEGELGIGAEDVPAVESMVQDTAKDVATFDLASLEIMKGKGKALGLPAVPVELKKEWSTAVEKARTVKIDAQMLMTQAKKAMEQAKAQAKKERLEEIKPRLLDSIKETTDKLDKIDEAVQLVEHKVEPFTRAKQSSAEEMLKLGDDAEPAIATAKEALEGAQGALEPPTMEVEDDIKKDVEAFFRTEAKRVKARLGQLGARNKRATNLISNYRKMQQRLKDSETIDAMKPEIMERVKAKAGEGWLELTEFDTQLKAAEKAVEALKKNAKATVDEMKALVEAAAPLIEEAQEGQVVARKAMDPFDDDLAPETKNKLKSFIAAELRDPELKIGKMEMRLDRAKRLVDQFQEGIAKKETARLEEIKGEVKRLIRHYQAKNSLSAEEVFAKIDKDSTGSIDETSFVEFLESEDVRSEGEDGAAKPPPKATTDDLKAVFASSCPQDQASISPEDFNKYMSSYMKVVKPTTMTAEFKVTAGKVLRQLKAGEALQILDGPMQDGKVGVKRVKGRVLSDETVGWATLMGNAGTILLKECSAEEAEAAAAATAPPAPKQKETEQDKA